MQAHTLGARQRRTLEDLQGQAALEARVGHALPPSVGQGLAQGSWPRLDRRRDDRRMDT